MPLIDTLRTKLGVPGRRRYETTQKTPAFEGMALKDKLGRIVHNCRNADRDARRRRNTVYYLMALYYSGFHNVELNASGNGFDVYEREDYYVENQFRKDVDTVVQMLNQMEGEITARPATDDPKDIATARVADHILQGQLDTIGYDKIRHTKNLYKALFGTCFVFLDYVLDKKYGVVVTPKYSYQEYPDPEGGDPYLTKVVDGYESRNRGQEICAVCSPLEINCTPDIKGGLDALPYLQWISRQDRDIVNYLYPGLNAFGGRQSDDDQVGDHLEVLGNLAGNITGESILNRPSTPNKVELVRTWAHPCTFLGDRELENKFKDGVHITTIDGTVVDWYAEDLTKRWTVEVGFPVPHSLYGDGLYDSILMQDQINEVNSIFIQHMRYATVGHKLYDQQSLDIKDVVNHPANGWIPVRNLGLERSIQQVVMPIQPGQLSSDVGLWKGNLLQSMQDMSGAYDPTVGKGLGANTPYSQSVFLNERAQSRWKGSNSYNKPELIHFHRQLLDIAKENWTETRTRAVADNTGHWSFQQFTQSDLSGNVDLILTSTDFKPRSRAEQIQGLQMLTTLAPLLPGMPPRQKLRIEEMLGLPPDANPMNAQISRARRHIDRIIKGEVVTPLPLVDDPTMQASVFQDFLVREEGEALAETDLEAYANVYTMMISLVQMGLAQMASAGGAMAGQIMAGPPSPSGPPKQGSPPRQPGQPGGQPGQPGGGPNPGDQAQTPAQPAPPVSPSAPAGG